MAREVIRHVQAARKNAGLNVDDRIMLSLVTDDGELNHAIADHDATIKAETLATIITFDAYEHASDATIEGEQLTVSLQKVA